MVDVGAGLARRINEVIVSAFINRSSATALASKGAAGPYLLRPHMPVEQVGKRRSSSIISRRRIRLPSGSPLVIPSFGRESITACLVRAGAAEI